MSSTHRLGTTRATARVATLRLDLPGLGPESPLPRFTPIRELPSVVFGEDAPAEMRARADFGRLRSPLPYALQSGYDRAPRATEVPMIELANDQLEVQVLPGLGGRVWSIRDKAADRELLHLNSGLRFGNLALTDAWFAGGIEWNFGSTGHWCLTCRPLHAGVVETADGPVVRLWEWERTRDLVVQIDLRLVEDLLVASFRISNPDPAPKPLYFWSTIAVPETVGTRVICDAQHAWRTSYDGGLARVTFPRPEVDDSRPAMADLPSDSFFDVVGRPFIAALEGDGRGMFETSTDRLTGRKLFVWGRGPGGDRWQEWLSGPDSRYCEIQAGLFPTQLEHGEIGAHEDVTWTETFGAIEAPRAASDDFADARREVADLVDQRIGAEEIEAWHSAWLDRVADAPVSETWTTGSGWGQVELELRGQPGSPAVPFPETGDDSSIARAVLRREGIDVSSARPAIPPVSDAWLGVLRDRTADLPHWWLQCALAVNAHLRGEPAEAERGYRSSMDLQPNLVAARGLALLAIAEDRTDDAWEWYDQACSLVADCRELLAEAGTWLVQSGQPERALQLWARVDDVVRRHGRLRLIEAQALTAVGRREAALEIVADLEVEDLAEGSDDLTALWQSLHPGVALPRQLDFRMTQEVAQ